METVPGKLAWTVILSMVQFSVSIDLTSPSNHSFCFCTLKKKKKLCSDTSFYFHPKKFSVWLYFPLSPPHFFSSLGVSYLLLFWYHLSCISGRPLSLPLNVQDRVPACLNTYAHNQHHQRMLQAALGLRWALSGLSATSVPLPRD